MCRNYWWHGQYCIWAKSKNFVVFKFWVKSRKKHENNEKKNQNLRRKLKLESNDAKYQADSENI